VLLLAAPASAVLPPPSEGLSAEDSLVAETRGAAAPERPSRIYSVQGPELKARLATALLHARGQSPRTDFWAGYTFETCASTDPDAIATELAVSGGIADVHKAVVLLRFGRDDATPQRVELRASRTPRGEAGLPVYWLGRAARDESLSFLISLMKGARAEHDAGELTGAVGLHGGSEAIGVLRDVARRSVFAAARARAATALVHHPEQSGFVAGIVLDEHELLDVRRAAAEALSGSHDPDARAILSSIYAKSSDAELKRVLKESALGKGWEVAVWPRSSRGEALSTLKQSSSSPPHGLPERSR
jgi:hypothetical protein